MDSSKELQKVMKEICETILEKSKSCFGIGIYYDNNYKRYILIDIKSGNIGDWRGDIESLAKYENVYCKMSGMVTEADWTQWVQSDFTPYLDVIFAAFGTNRVMFGSDWPVCQVAADYGQVVGIMQNYLSRFSEDEQHSFWGGNAIKFYSLK